MHRASWILVALAIACGGRTHRGEPAAPELVAATPEVALGGKLFRKFCYQCHPGGAGGIGPALNDKPLPELAIRTQIRVGVGAMPAFADWMTDDEIRAVTEYVKTLRRAPKSRPLDEPVPAEGTITARQ